MQLIESVKQSSWDIRLLWISVFTRMMSFGLTNQILTLYLKEIGILESKIGLFMTLTLVGDTVISMFLTWNANKIGNRRIMSIGSLLMVLSGITFFSGTENYYILLLSAIFGVISPSGDETGPFKSIEESVIAKLTPLHFRHEIYAIHWMLGALANALGSLLAGYAIDILINHYKLNNQSAYRISFIIYISLSLIKFISINFLSSNCDTNQNTSSNSNANTSTTTNSISHRNSRLSLDESSVLSSSSINNNNHNNNNTNNNNILESEPLVSKLKNKPSFASTSTALESSATVADDSLTSYGSSSSPVLSGSGSGSGLGAGSPVDERTSLITSTIEHNTATGLSQETQSLLIKLVIPFMIDSLGYGFMTNAWIVYYFKLNFKLSASILGSLFFITSLVQCLSSIPSVYLSYTYGPIKSFMITQLPCGLFFMLIPILGNSIYSNGHGLTISSILLILQQFLSSMDVVPRQILLTSLISNYELVKVLGIVNIGKTFARCIGPIFTGYLAELGLLYTCFIIAGGLLILSNLLLTFSFINLDHIIKSRHTTRV